MASNDPSTQLPILGSMAMAVPYVLPTLTWPTTETGKLLVLAAPTTPENIVASTTTTTSKKKTAVDRLGASLGMVVANLSS